MNLIEKNTIKANKVVQNNQEFLITVVPVSTLMKYTKYTERLIVDFDENNNPVYNQEIQRKTDASKVNLIADYLINDPEAMFPTNIVLAIPSFIVEEYVENNEQVKIILSNSVLSELKKPDGHVYISVIDGQHRLKGLELAIESINKKLSELFLSKYEKERLIEKLENLLRFQVAVSFFIDPVLEYQASIFSTINRTQTKVSESLVYSLFGLTDKESPQRSALEITLALNGLEKPKSPFFNRIKLVGKSYKRNESPPLTQATMVKSIIKCISPTVREAERDRFKNRHELLRGINPELCFRRYYALNKDSTISKILFAFYSAVENVFVNEEGKPYWDMNSKENILQKTVGYEALLSLLKIILYNIDRSSDAEEIREQNKVSINFYSTILSTAKDKNIQFDNFDIYPKTSLTKTKLFEDLRMKTIIDA